MSAGAAPAVVREVIPLSAFEVGDIDVEVLPQDTLPPDIAYCLDAEVETGGISADERAYVDLFDDDTVGWFEGLAVGGASLFAPTVKARYAAWRRWAGPADRLALDWAGLRGMRWRFDEVAREVAYAAARDGGPSGDADAAGRVRRALLSTREAAAFVDGLAAIVARTAEDVAASGPGTSRRQPAVARRSTATAGTRSGAGTRPSVPGRRPSARTPRPWPCPPRGPRPARRPSAGSQGCGAS